MTLPCGVSNYFIQADTTTVTALAWALFTNIPGEDIPDGSDVRAPWP